MSQAGPVAHLVHVDPLGELLLGLGGGVLVLLLHLLAGPGAVTATLPVRLAWGTDVRGWPVG